VFGQRENQVRVWVRKLQWFLGSPSKGGLLFDLEYPLIEQFYFMFSEVQHTQNCTFVTRHLLMDKKIVSFALFEITVVLYFSSYFIFNVHDSCFLRPK
jgi:hypothetical protein